MTPEEAQLTQRGAAILAAYLREDTDGLSALLIDPTLSEAGDSLIMAAIVAGESLRLSKRCDLAAAFDSVPQVLHKITGVGEVDWSAAVVLAKAVKTGDKAGIAEGQAGLDVPTAVNSAFSLALSTTNELAHRTGVPAQTWLQRWVLGAANPDVYGRHVDESGAS